MRRITIHLKGNHEDPQGNPVPFQRVLKQKMRAASLRYMAWGDFVRAAMIDQNRGIQLTMEGKIRMAPGEYAAITSSVVWADETHGDLDNVIKGVLDAVLEQDKEVVRNDQQARHGVRGSCAVNITIAEEEEVLLSP